MSLLPKVSATVSRAGSRILDARERHHERHTPSGFRFALFDSIHMVRTDHWDALVKGHSVCLSRPFLELVERHGPANIRPHYALIYQGEVPVAAVAAQSLEASGSTLPRPRSGKATLERLAAKPLARLKERILVCGNLLSWGPHGTAFAGGLPSVQLWPAVAEAL